MKISRRNTTSKTLILDILKQSESALSHSEISKLVNGACDRVTIYRVLDRLTQDHLVHKIVNSEGVIKYALCDTNVKNHSHNHVHFSCNNCKSVVCLNEVVPNFTLPNNYIATDYNFIISGLCHICNK